MSKNFELSMPLVVEWYALASRAFNVANDDGELDLGWYEGVMDVFNALVAFGEGSDKELMYLLTVLEEFIENEE